MVYLFDSIRIGFRIRKNLYEIILFYINYLTYHQNQQQLSMSQTLQGDYYEAGKNGYSNRGKEIIKFSAKVNHLHVHSRCNKLLKSEEHPIKVLPSQKLEAVHCYHNASIQKSKRSSTDNHDKFQNNVSLIQKPHLPKIYKQNSLNPEQRSQKSLDQQFSNSKRNQRKVYEHHVRRSSRSQSREPINCSMNQLSPPSKDIQDEKIRFTKTALKKSFSPIDVQYSPQEVKSDQLQEQEQKKLKAKIKKIHNQQQISREGDDDECITQHAVYQPQKVNNFKVIQQQKYLQQQKLLGQLSNLVRKVSRLQQKIKATEEQFTIKNLQSQISKSNSKLSQLSAQNLRLKSKQSVNHGRCGFECRRVNQYQSQGFIYFIIFMLGILLTKAALC